MSNETKPPMLAKPPPDETDESVYSNFDHRLEADVAAELERRPGEVCAQHAAWNFCGYIWRMPDGRWIDQVWHHGSPVRDIIGDTLREVIEDASDSYGHD